MAESSVLSFKENFWQGLLLTASLLSCWHPTTTIRMTNRFVPFPMFEGENFVLHVTNLTDNLTAFVWFKEITEKSHDIALYAANAKASPLTCGHPPTSAQPSIELVPPNVSKGGSVLLRVHNLPEKIQEIFWYKGVGMSKNQEVSQYVIAKDASVDGPAHSGRETVYSNGSLLIHSVTGKDTGFYTLRTLSTDLKEEVVHVQLLVGGQTQLTGSQDQRDADADGSSILCEDGTCIRGHGTPTVTLSKSNASYLTCGPLPTSTQLSIESVPPRVSEGGSALLLVHNLPRNVRIIFWYKGVVVFERKEVAHYVIARNSSRRGPAHSGRETLYSNGSLLIHNVTWNHIGFYTLRIRRTNMREQVASVQLQMDASLSTCCNHLNSAPLMIDQVPPNVAKGENVVLHVYNLPQDLQAFYWYKSAYRSQLRKIAEYSIFTNSIIRGPKYSRRMTVYTNGSLLLHSVTEKDAGFYTLETLNREFKITTAHARLDITCIHPSTTGQLSIELVPPNIVKGNNALLLAHNMPKKLRAFCWYKWVGILYKNLISGNETTTNKRTLGPAYSGRETLYPNGSLLLHNVTQEDTGFYTLRTLNMQFETQETHMQLHIYKPLTQPYLWVANSTVRVQSSVVLTCLSAHNDVSTEWFFNDRELQLTERMTLSPTKCWLRIDPVRMEDSGKYLCEISNPVSSRSSPPIFLAVIKA